MRQALRASTARAGMVVIILTCLMTMSSCAFYNHPWDLPASGPGRAVDFTIQVDDVGKFWNPEAAEQALRTIETVSAKTNTIVVLYIHGWHHNASSGDDNLKDFGKSVALVRALLQQDMYARSRDILTCQSDVRVFGIYVGWRGRSLPGWADYATFWGRKGGAEQAGEGDLREFLTRLNLVYLRQNKTAVGAENGKPFMGLAAFGHSFGGQVLFKALRPAFEAELLEAGRRTGNTAPGQLDPLRTLAGFGDLVVLVNPALEALQFERIHALGRQIAYPPTQPPLLFVITAENDDARSFWFPKGRAAGGLFSAPLRPEVRTLWSRALGSYEPQQTHEIIPVGKLDENWQFDPAVYASFDQVLNYDLTRKPLFLSKGGMASN